MTCTHRSATILFALSAGITLLTGCSSTPNSVEVTETTTSPFTAQDRAFLATLDESFDTDDPKALTTVGSQVCVMILGGKNMEQVMNRVVKYTHDPDRSVDFIHAAKNAYCP